MTREETIKWLESLKTEIGKSEHRALWHYSEALDMAIEALSADAKGDLIRRSDIQYHTQLEPMGNGQYSDVEVAYKDDIDALPSADAEWIPCSERLPSDGGEYIVFYEGTIIGSNIEIMWYGEPLMPNVDVSGKHFYRSDSEWGDIIYDEVIAWMPLPKPYKGGDD